MQNWKKGYVFGQTDKFWKEHDRQIKKNACKNACLGSCFTPEKYVIRVLFVSPWTSLIPPLAIRVAPSGKVSKRRCCCNEILPTSKQNLDSFTLTTSG